jgi:hypothetical protein
MCIQVFGSQVFTDETFRIQDSDISISCHMLGGDFEMQNVSFDNLGLGLE